MVNYSSDFPAPVQVPVEISAPVSCDSLSPASVSPVAGEEVCPATSFFRSDPIRVVIFQLD